MRCRCSDFRFVAPIAALFLLAGSASAQIVAGGGDAPKGGERFDVDLFAAAEVPGPGDPDLDGSSAKLTVDPRRGRVCFDVDLKKASGAKGADNVVALHVHPGEAGSACEDGQECLPPIDLDFANEGLRGCAKRIGTPLLNAIIERPEQFYLHVHTGRFPAGAVRGQLEDSGEE